MKKIMLWVLVVVCVLVSVEAVFAAYGIYSRSNKSVQSKIDKFNSKIEALALEVQKLGDNIAIYNKPIFEAKLTKSERAFFEGGYTTILWNRVYAKDKTLVFGYAEKDKKFLARYLITTDPKFAFSGGIRVGASTNVLERFFGDSLSNMGNVKGKVTELYGYYETDDLPPMVFIKCANGIITEIGFDVGFGYEFVASVKAVEFARKKAREMGLTYYDIFPRQ